MRNPRSLQGRLLLLVIGGIAVVWLATASATWYDMRRELDELLDSHLAQAAALLVVQQGREVEDEDHELEAPALHRYAPKVAFQVFHEGRLELRSVNAPAWPTADATGTFQSGFRTMPVDGVDWRVFAAHGRTRDVQVYVGEQVDSRASILWAAMRSTLWPISVALPLLALASWWAVVRGMAPLRELGRTLGERQPQALQPVVVADAPLEMTPMLDALNGLFDRISRLIESERRFTADAAHELRTPIAAIRAQAQVALVAGDDAAVRRHALQSTLAGCDRAARLVEQLLTLSRLEAGVMPVMVTLDLGALARRVVADAAPHALQKGQTIELEAPETCPVPGDATLLEVLVRNLVDNAIRYSAHGAMVSVAVTRRRNQVVLEVQDSGPGLDDNDLRRLGERFFRVAGSAESGSGLGWSIVRRVAAAHLALVHVRRSKRLGGLEVEVDLPLATADGRGIARCDR